MSTYLSPANVMVLVQRDDGRVLAVRHNETSKTSPNQVTVVGGKLEEGEFVHEGALRELTEETGVHVAAEDLEFCQLAHYKGPDGMRVIGTVFTAQRWRGEPRNAEPGKHDAILWIDPGSPPPDCHPYTREVLASFTAGRLYTTLTVPAGGGTS
ncbi:NUDIX domain-containing protein [Streptomyces viridochromogenes]|uniref:Putative NUDIX hydrolase n=1 Tax=Streptomyces viridochromogenes Tue57 TaxID=1160705 RepID=L8PID2_STRVR|nr:NUDIX domain-containing protein [Streptomyces viridochromogenes]ELS55798.1 putative NUDIX hydrolase [Streptomyces viridochromogenes Tue57]